MRTNASIVAFAIVMLGQYACKAQHPNVEGKVAQSGVPKLDSAEVFRRKLACAKLGAQVAKARDNFSLKEKEESYVEGNEWPDPVYGYSESLNACLFVSGSLAVHKRDEFWMYEATIENLFTNRVLAHCMIASGQPSDMPWSTFVAKYEHLFADEPPEWISKNPEVQATDRRVVLQFAERSGSILRSRAKRSH
jgi:hypothetical protein